MEILLTKITAQGWSNILLQGTIQRKLAKKIGDWILYQWKVYGIEFTSTILGVLIKLTRVDVARILDVPSEGWSHYVKFT